MPTSCVRHASALVPERCGLSARLTSARDVPDCAQRAEMARCRSDSAVLTPKRRDATRRAKAIISRSKAISRTRPDHCALIRRRSASSNPWGCECACPIAGPGAPSLDVAEPVEVVLDMVPLAKLLSFATRSLDDRPSGSSRVPAGWQIGQGPLLRLRSHSATGGSVRRDAPPLRICRRHRVGAVRKITRVGPFH